MRNCGAPDDDCGEPDAHPKRRRVRLLSKQTETKSLVEQTVAVQDDQEAEKLQLPEQTVAVQDDQEAEKFYRPRSGLPFRMIRRLKKFYCPRSGRQNLTVPAAKTKPPSRQTSNWGAMKKPPSPKHRLVLETL